MSSDTRPVLGGGGESLFLAPLATKATWIIYILIMYIKNILVTIHEIERKRGKNLDFLASYFISAILCKKDTYTFDVSYCIQQNYIK